MIRSLALVLSLTICGSEVNAQRSKQVNPGGLATAVVRERAMWLSGGGTERSPLSMLRWLTAFRPLAGHGIGHKPDKKKRRVRR